MRKRNVILNKKKMILFGIVIDILVTSILSFGSYDIINAFYGEIMPVSRLSFFLTLFPNILIIIATIIISYTLLSIKYEKKTK